MAPGQETVKPDFTKIVPYSPTDDDQKRETTVRKYQGNGKELLYINASHVHGIDNPTCDSIRETIELLKPQRVVVEGREGGSGGEAAFAELLCRKHSIPVVYGEPDDRAIFKAMTNTEYYTKDIMALYLLRNVAQDRRMGMDMDEASFAERAHWYLSSHPCFESIEPDGRLTYEEFKTKYAPKLGGKNVLAADANDFAPYLTKNATYFQHLHGTIAQVREKLITATIANALNEPGTARVLVIYGGAHRIMSGPMWEAALGKGIDIDPKAEATVHTARQPCAPEVPIEPPRPVTPRQAAIRQNPENFAQAGTVVAMPTSAPPGGTKERSMKGLS